MNNMQLYLSIGIPSFLVILSWLSNRTDSAALRADMAALRGEMIARDVNTECTAFVAKLVPTLPPFVARSTLNSPPFVARSTPEMVGLRERMVKIETKQANS